MIDTGLGLVVLAGLILWWRLSRALDDRPSRRARGWKMWP